MSFKKAEEGVTEPGEETIRRLAQLHFPQATIHENYVPYSAERAAMSADIRGKYDFISKRKVSQTE